MKMREEIGSYLPTADQAAKTTMADFNSTVATAAAALERLSIAADEARIRAGDTQKGVKTTIAGAEQKGAEGVSWFAKKFPGLTGVAGAATSATSGLLYLGAELGLTAVGLRTFGLALKSLLGKAYFATGAGALRPHRRPHRVQPSRSAQAESGSRASWRKRRRARKGRSNAQWRRSSEP